MSVFIASPPGAAEQENKFEEFEEMLKAFLHAKSARQSQGHKSGPRDAQGRYPLKVKQFKRLQIEGKPVTDEQLRDIQELNNLGEKEKTLARKLMNAVLELAQVSNYTLEPMYVNYIQQQLAVEDAEEYELMIHYWMKQAVSKIRGTYVAEPGMTNAEYRRSMGDF